MNRLKDEEKEQLCKKYFLGGFFLLPFLWITNFFWFFNEAFRRPSFPQQPSIRKYVVYSGIGSLVWIIGIVTWVVIYQVHRAEWGEFGDRISFIIPTGIP